MTESYRIGSEAIAGPYLEDEVVCPRNPIVQALKPVLTSSRPILPDAIYEPLYDMFFASYKNALRISYLRHVAARWLAGDRAGLFRAQSVHKVMPYSLVGASGLEATFDSATELVKNQTLGDFVEWGAARGGGRALMETVRPRAF